MSGNYLSWRLLASPISVLDHADVAFIGLNPGGNFVPAEHPKLATEFGSAYTDEVWGPNLPPGESRLQIQVQTLFRHLQIPPENVLAGNLVPFRSPTFKALFSKKESISFGKVIWKEIFLRAKPSLVICMGSETFRAIGDVLNAKPAVKIPVNWGRISAKKSFSNDAELVGLPHLSRFGIVTRAQSQDALSKIFGPYWAS